MAPRDEGQFLRGKQYDDMSLMLCLRKCHRDVFYLINVYYLLGSITSPAAEEVSLKLLLMTTVTYNLSISPESGYISILYHVVVVAWFSAFKAITMHVFAISTVLVNEEQF